MKWQQGRAAIDKMLADGELERVQASREHADRLVSQARRHLDSAQATCESDPEGAYGTLYDAGRKSLWAILANQGAEPSTVVGWSRLVVDRMKRLGQCTCQRVMLASPPAPVRTAQAASLDSSCGEGVGVCEPTSEPVLDVVVRLISFEQGLEDWLRCCP